jgi:hypothetical protein
VLLISTEGIPLLQIQVWILSYITGEILQQDPLESCHGIEWDSNRKVVFALGRQYIQKYTYDP